MHSSRMRTGRSLTVCQSLLLGGGALNFPLGCGPGSDPLGCGPGPDPPQFPLGCGPGGGCLLLGGGLIGGGASFLGGCLLGGGASFLGGGGSPWQGGGIQACTEADPPVNRITHCCKNITLATTSLRPVIIYLLACTSETEKIIRYHSNSLC